MCGGGWDKFQLKVMLEHLQWAVKIIDGGMESTKINRGGGGVQHLFMLHRDHFKMQLP